MDSNNHYLFIVLKPIPQKLADALLAQVSLVEYEGYVVIPYDQYLDLDDELKLSIVPCIYTTIGTTL